MGAVDQVSRWEKERLALAQHVRAGDTLGAWCDHWLTTKEGTIAPKTQAFYSDHVGYGVGQIGTIRLIDLQPQDIRDCIAALDRLAPQSRKNVLKVLSMALRLAVNDGVITRNPCDAVDSPRVTRYEAYALSADELRRFYAAVAGTRLEALWHVLADLGPRIGEALALRWADLDRERRTLRVRGTKTDRERYLSLTATHMALLDTHWHRLQDERTDNPRWTERGFLFPSEVGTALDDASARRTFKTVLEKAGLPKVIRLHDLRHTAATNLIAAGNDPTTVQYLTGHRDSSVLLEIYSHHQEDRNRAAIERVEERRSKRG